MISDKLCEIRSKAGLNKKEFAERLGVKYTTYNGYETGSREPASDFLILVSKKFNVSIDYIMGLTDTSEKLHSYNLRSEEIEHIKNYRKLEPLWQQAVDGLIETGLKQNLVLEPIPTTTIYPFPYCSNMSASAGTGMPVLDMANFETVELKKAPPKGSTFLVRVAGNSMEPTYHDGDVVFIKRQDIIRIGEVGLWMVDGLAYIKERGDNCLISHNEGYSPIEIDEYTQVMCYGKVTGICDEL